MNASAQTTVERKKNIDKNKNENENFKEKKKTQEKLHINSWLAHQRRHIFNETKRIIFCFRIALSRQIGQR